MAAVLKPQTEADTTITHIACPHDCPDTCSLLVTVDRATGKATKVQADPAHPYTRGYLCGKVNHYLDYVYNERRVLYPRKRVGVKGLGAKWERISWDEALGTRRARWRFLPPVQRPWGNFRLRARDRGIEEGRARRTQAIQWIQHTGRRESERDYQFSRGGHGWRSGVLFDVGAVRESGSTALRAGAIRQ
jgi:anaerobic selenocysteine-containing dehydrogenase